MPWRNGNPPLYTRWREMKRRCYDKQFKQYRDYGGRGIIVCREWILDYKQFFADMYPTYKEGLTLDRKDNNGNYSKQNCKWSTRKEQQRNQRRNVKVIVEGKEYLAVALADISGQKTDVIVERARAGLTYKEIINPSRRMNLDGFKLGASISAAKRNSRTHCKRGHEFTVDNTKLLTRGKYTWRTCRACDSRAKRAQADQEIALGKLKPRS